MKVKKVGILTSGGDSPGMNAFIYEISKLFIKDNVKLIGFLSGFAGITEKKIFEITPNMMDAFSIGKMGGSFIKCGRFEELKSRKSNEILAHMRETLKELEIDWLVVLGGNGSLEAVKIIGSYTGCITFVPASIDNDINISEYSIGFDTALNNMIRVIDDIRDTANSLSNRIFLVETLGGDCGNISLAAYKSGVSDLSLIPEKIISYDEVADIVEQNIEQKGYSIITVCEGLGYTQKLADYLSQKLNKKIRVTILGHQQRGGNPTFFDRYMAKQFALKTYQNINDGMSGAVVLNGGMIATITLP